MTHAQSDPIPMVYIPATGHHCLMAGIKLYYLETEAHVCLKKLLKAEQLGVKHVTLQLPVQLPNCYTTMPHKLGVY